MIGVTKMLCGGQKYWNYVLAINSLKPCSLGLGTQTRSWSKKSETRESECCKDLAQTEGRKVEPWPREDPPLQGSWPKFDHRAAAWRCECPRDPPPPNNDPYRIKLPETVVPPLPPSDVKEMQNEECGLFDSPEIHTVAAYPGLKDLFHNSPIIHPDYWKNKAPKVNKSYQDLMPKLGYHGRTKYKFAFHEPWRPLDRLSLLGEAERMEAEQRLEAEVAYKEERNV